MASPAIARQVRKSCAPPIPRPMLSQVEMGHLAWARRLARSIHRKLPASFDVQDLEQEAVISCWKCLQAFDLRRQVPFRLYAYNAVRGAVLMAVRRRHWREATHPELPEDVMGETPREMTVSEIHRQQLGVRAWRLVDSLPQRERAVILLHYLRHYDMRTVALYLGLSLQRTFMLRRQALDALNERLRPLC